jgi:hypothetical protein
MAIEVQNLAELTTAEIEAAHELITQMVAEENPSVDLKRGVIHDLVIHLSALLGAAKDKEIDRLRRSMSLNTILEDPLLADADIVEAVLGNYRVTRRQGAFSFGEVTISVTKFVSLTVPLDMLFTIGGTIFQLNTSGSAVAVRTSAAQVDSASDRLLQQTGTGLWSFTVPVVATTAGLLAEAKRGNPVSLNRTLLNFSSAHASNDFNSGGATETNDQLLTRFQEGVAAKAWSNRVTIAAMIQDQDAFTAVSDISIIGMNDAEMRRDQHSILPISFGGRSDLYIRSAQTPVTVTHQLNATYMDDYDGGGYWQLSVTRDLAPGFYEVSRVALTTANASDTGYEITSDVRGFDLSNEGFPPDIATAQEAAYSKYQTAVIQFSDTDTDVTSLTKSLSTQLYDVTFKHMPLIDALQNYVNEREVRNPAGDMLVKGAVPAFMVVNLTIKKRAQDPVPDLDAIKNEIALEINSLGFQKAIHASQIADVIHSQLSPSLAVADIDMFVRIRTPAQETIYVRSGDVIEIPDKPADLVSPRTVVFLLEREDIGITVENI